MKALYIPVGAQGHILASLPLVEELVKKGVEVLYIAPEQYRKQVELTGAAFTTMPVVAGKDSVDAGDDFIAGIPLVFLGEAEGVLPDVEAAVNAFKPDVIISDALAVAGRLVASKYNLPLVLMHTSYAANEHFAIDRFWPKYPDTHPARAKALEMAKSLQARYGGKLLTTAEIFEGSGDYNIVTMTRTFHPAGETFGDNYFFAGAQIAKRENSGTWQPPTNGKPLLYTSLGSLFNNWPEFYQMLFPIVRDMDINVLCSLGKVLKPEDLGDIPANVQLMAFTPQLEVLEHTTYFISHCGTGSAMESLYYGVPVLGIPMMDEQIFTANRMKELQCASAVLTKPEVTEETLRAGLEELIQNPVYRQNAAAMAKEMHEEGGADRAAQAVINFVGK